MSRTLFSLLLTHPTKPEPPLLCSDNGQKQSWAIRPQPPSSASQQQSQPLFYPHADRRASRLSCPGVPPNLTVQSSFSWLPHGPFPLPTLVLPPSPSSSSGDGWISPAIGIPTWKHLSLTCTRLVSLWVFPFCRASAGLADQCTHAGKLAEIHFFQLACSRN